MHSSLPDLDAASDDESLCGSPVQDALQGNAGPGWTIAQLVAQFVPSFFQFKQAQQSAARLQRPGRVKPGVARRRIVRRKKRGALYHLPSSRHWGEPDALGFVVRDIAQGAVLHV